MDFNTLAQHLIQEQTTAPNPVNQALPIPSTQTGQSRPVYKNLSSREKVISQSKMQPVVPVGKTKMAPKNSYEAKLYKTIQRGEKEKIIKDVEEDAETETNPPDSRALKIIDVQLPSVQKLIKDNEALMNQSKDDAAKFNQYSGVATFWKGVEYGFNYLKKNLSK
ncbi:MAG: hypothetical protein ACOYNN_17530 [Terrimicrobiaceae bacterium]